MLLKEYRIILPLTVEEYQIGQLFSVSETSKSETGGGEGVQVIANEPFHDKPFLKSGKFSSGQYTKKIYHLQSKVPSIIKMIAPKDALELHEESWNAYPYCRTILTSPWKNDFLIKIESMHCPDRGEQENAHELSQELLKKREVVRIDIANDTVASGDYKEETDPKKFKSEKTLRGPLVDPKWSESCQPVMTCYKLVTCECKMFLLQSRMEKIVQSSEKRLFTNFHREVFCSMDKWFGMTVQDIRDIEKETKKQLDELRRRSMVRGTAVTEE